jgi:hypothetical protein
MQERTLNPIATLNDEGPTEQRVGRRHQKDGSRTSGLRISMENLEGAQSFAWILTQ